MNRTTRLRRCTWPRQQWRSVPARRWQSAQSLLPIVKLDNATFYRKYPSDSDSATTNPPIFPKLTFSLPPNLGVKAKQFWAVVSPASVARTTFLQVLNSQYLSIPPEARSFPFLSSAHIKDAQSRTPDRAIKYVGFDAERGGFGGTSIKGAYLSARYEARKEETDWSLNDYLAGNTELNPYETDEARVDHELLHQVVEKLRLRNLLDRPVGNLSNGQTRRARIAKSLLSKPELLLLDGPFMGLDPRTVEMLSLLLSDMAENNAPRIFLSLRPEDHVPPWITHIVYIDDAMNVLSQGRTQDVFDHVLDRQAKWPADAAIVTKLSAALTPRESPPSEVDLVSRDGLLQYAPSSTPGEPIVQMEGVKVSYGPSDSPARQTVLGDWQQSGETSPGLHWTISRNQRIGVFGPNGSGKTTLLSLITSDHPQTYSLPIKLFGRSRLPGPGQPGISIFELQKRMGHSSPEVHTFFPKHLSVRRVLESAWADAPLAKPKLTHENDYTVDALLRWFAADLSPTGQSLLADLKIMRDTVLKGRRSVKGKKALADKADLKRRISGLKGDGNDLDWADSLTFRDLSFSQQRLALFLRAIVASPDLVILDEAFSGIDVVVRDKCLLFLSHGETKEWATVTIVPKDDQPPFQKRVLQNSILTDNGGVIFRGLTDQQAMLVISHSKEDVPGCVTEWICLPEPGEGRTPRWGSLDGPLELNPQGWSDIWATDDGA